MSFSLLDLVALIVLLIAITSSYRAGFVKAISGVISKVATLICAYIFSKPLATWAYDKFNVGEYVKNLIATNMDKSLAAVNASGDSYRVAINEGFDNFVQGSGIFRAFLENYLSEVPSVEVALNNTSAATRDMVVDTISTACDPMIMTALNALAFLAIMIVGGMVMSIVLSSLGKILGALPITGTVNHFLGALAGLFKGLIYSAITLLICCILISLLGLDATLVQNSFILGLFGLV